MKKLIFLLISILFLIAVFCGCGAPTPAAVSADPSGTSAPTAGKTADVEENHSIYGVLEGDQYVNRALKFTAQIPDGWLFASAEEIRELTGQVDELIEGVVDMKSNTTVTLMICSQYKLDPNGPPNPNVNIAYSNQSSVLQILSDAAAFEEMIQQLEASYSEMYTKIYPDAVVSTTGEQNVLINGKEYAVTNTQTVVGDIAMNQDQYFTQLEGGALTITATYYDEAGKGVLDEFVNNLVYE